jgi:hypothetical protein
MAAKVMAMPDRAIEPQQIASKQSNSTTAALQRADQKTKQSAPSSKTASKMPQEAVPYPQKCAPSWKIVSELILARFRYTPTAPPPLCAPK